MATAEATSNGYPASRKEPSDREKSYVQPQEIEESGTGEEHVEIRKKEAKVVAKLDSYVCPIMIILQLLSFLDRGNIGYPRSFAQRHRLHELMAWSAMQRHKV